MSRVSQNIVFANPTLRLLARHLVQLLAAEVMSSPAPDPKEEIEDMIAKCSVGLAGKVRKGL